MSPVVVRGPDTPPKRPHRPPAGQVTIWQNGGPRVTALLWAQPEGTLGAGGWENLARDGDDPIGTFRGREFDTYSLTIRVHELTSADVSEDVARIKAMGRKTPAGHPPKSVYAIGELPFAPDFDLRIDGPITLGPRKYKPGSRLHLKYQELTIPLSEQNLVDLVGQGKPTRTRTTGKPRTRTVKSHAGDTLRVIAIAELGSASRWTDLRSWNAKLKKTDPDSPLRPGTRILVKR